MASTILYKFRSGTTFEALPLPGSAARLFDVKKAIVKAKKLDSGSMEFDLGVRNADTNEEYSNEAMLLPRGTRLIVQRLPAQRGQGFLARMARNEQTGTGMATQSSNAASNSFYTIESRAGDDDEFVQAAPANEEKELAALQAATNLQSGGPAMTGGGYASSRSNFPSGGGGGQKRNFHATQNFRPNADPELRAQEQKLQPKKARTTGIPRTFQSHQASRLAEGAEGEEAAVPVLQPNSQGFKDLVSRGGGQSENVTGTRHDLDYALKLTASTVPDYLLCPICDKTLRNAMLLPWDPEGRSTCESCIRDALTQSGFRCPLTGMEGVSPDDLRPNLGLRKAVEMFIKGVMDKVDEVEQMRVEEDENVGTETSGGSGLTGDILEGDRIEKGVIVSRKSSIVRKKLEEDDPFADDDDFGGDVFAVDVDKPTEEETEEKKEEPKEADVAPTTQTEDKTATSESKEADSNRVDKVETNPNSRTDPSTSGNAPDATTSDEVKVGENESQKQVESPAPPKRRRRGPPAGYTMGPAGYNRNKDNGDRRGGRYQKNDGGYRGRGGGGHRGGRDNDYNNRGGGRYDGDGGNDHGQDDDRGRGSKRSRNDDHSDGHRDKHARHERYDDTRDNRYSRSDDHDDRNRRGEGGGRGFHRGGYNRGGRGRSWGGRGGSGGGYRGRRY